MSLVMNGVLLFMAYNLFMGGGSKGAPPAGAAPAAAPAMAVDGGMDAEFVTSTSVAGGGAPSQYAKEGARPVQAPPPSRGGAPSMMDMFTGRTAGLRQVSDALQPYEDARKSALARVAPSVALSNLWAPGDAFSLYVYLSQSAEPVAGVGAAHAAYAKAVARGEYSDTTAELLADRPPARRLDWATLFSANSNLYDLTATSPAITYPSAVFDAVWDGGVSEGEPVPAWVMHGLTYDWSDTNYRDVHLNISLPAAVRNNGTLYAHVYACPDNEAADEAETVHVVYPLIKLLSSKPSKATHNLLGGDDGGSTAPATVASFGIVGNSPAPPAAADGTTAAPETVDATKVATPMPYFRPALHFQLADDRTVYQRGGMPPHIANNIHVVPGRAGYLPVAAVNDFWQLGHELVPLNDSVAVVPLHLSYSMQASWKLLLQTQMQASWDMQAAMGTSRDDDTDMLKSIILQTNPILLAVTIIVSTLHSVFDLLAFKNDISFWRSTKSMEGLSIRSISINLFFQAVILAYLFDNDTSWMVLVSNTLGFAIEVWKLRKAVAFGVRWNGWLPSIQWEDAETTYAASRTKEYDDIATNHMLLILYPLVAGYAGYSLYYDRHRSWMSWILSSLTGFVYTFGFIQMVPQLYINYRVRVPAPFRHSFKFPHASHASHPPPSPLRSSNPLRTCPGAPWCTSRSTRSSTTCLRGSSRCQRTFRGYCRPPCTATTMARTTITPPPTHTLQAAPHRRVPRRRHFCYLPVPAVDLPRRPCAP